MDIDAQQSNVVNCHRQTFAKEWLGQNIWIRFLDKSTGRKYCYPHDQHLNAVINYCGIITGAISWEKTGHYSHPTISRIQRDLLAPYEII
jgi:hypothetical protein